MKEFERLFIHPITLKEFKYHIKVCIVLAAGALLGYSGFVCNSIHVREGL